MPTKAKANMAASRAATSGGKRPDHWMTQTVASRTQAIVVSRGMPASR